MKVEMKYGRGILEVEVPDKNLVALLTSQQTPPLEQPDTAISDAIQSPISSLPLSVLANGRTSACVVISDITRPVPNQILLPPLLNTLEQAGIPREQIVILVATGIHRPTTLAELPEMVGADIINNYRIVNHHSERPETHNFLGLTRNGTPVHIDTTYLDADLKIVTGLIEPHLMAGYSGGRKAVCPGIASIETVKVMHGPGILEHPNARAGILDDNPFHQEATEIALMAGVDFNLNVAIDHDRRITGVFAGGLIESHQDGCHFVANQVTATVMKPADTVLVSSAGYPLDTTFYQAVKGLLAAVEIVKERGTIILVAECSQGIGSKAFTELILKTQDLGQFVRDLYDSEKFVVDQWQLEELVKVAKKADIYLYSDGIPSQQQEQLFVQPLQTPKEGVQRALAKHGTDAQIAAIPDGPYVLAQIQNV